LVTTPSWNPKDVSLQKLTLTCVNPPNAQAIAKTASVALSGTILALTHLNKKVFSANAPNANGAGSIRSSGASSRLGS
jgi:hypothetical protein